MADVALRPVAAGDEPFLLRVYAGTRAEELAPVPWTEEQKAAFVAQQFAAQTAHYAQHYAGMTADVILIGGEPAGRLLVARWADGDPDRRHRDPAGAARHRRGQRAAGGSAR